MTLERLRIDELANAWVGDRNTPFQLGLLGVFDAGPWARPDGTVDVEGLRHELALRARGLNVLNRRVLWTRPWQGRPVWVRDPHFDAAQHVLVSTLPAGEDLATWAANRCVRPLPLDRPLWRPEVIGGLPAGRYAVLIVVHHILADGLAGVRLVGSLLDPTPDAPHPDQDPVTGPPTPSPRALVRDWLHAGVRPRVRAPSATEAPAGSARQPIAGLRQAWEGFRVPLPATSLPRRVGPRRVMTVATQDLETARRTGHALGVTINDLVLAVVTDGMRGLLAARGDDLDGIFLRATVPVATSATGQAMGMIVVDLPVGESDPLRRLAEISTATSERKARLRASGGAVTDILHVPLPVAWAVVRWGRRVGSRRVNLSVSDLPGPSTPLWLAGSRMLQVVPVAPLVPLVPISVAALSYAGTLTITVNADAALGELEVLGEAMRGSLVGYARLSSHST
ncbi:wax ester/triacylglycerol synthase domain-containing protein [Terrabacter sp. NPDC080008]|uniref:wax ester/triacylglycerol synthase domain-containing protein n=1 Tax=Terrabacter sp. NPDC080008 TaxID=3155176 RepID=UPI0034503479